MKFKLSTQTILISILLLSYFFSFFKLFEIFNYCITLALFVPIVAFSCLKKIKKSHLFIFSALFTTPHLIALVNVIIENEINEIRYLRSASLYSWSIITYLSAHCAGINSQFSKKLAKITKIFLVLTFLWTICQAVAAKFGNYTLYNVFGDRLVGGVAKVGRFESVSGYLRPTAFYYEPSLLSLFVLSAFSIVALLESKKTLKLMSLNIIFQLVIQSSLGIIISAIILVLVSLRRIKCRSITIFSLLFILPCIIYTIIKPRISEIFWPGTSGYYRFSIPFKFFSENLEKYPIGLPLGQLPYPFDNSFINIQIYLGCFSIAVGFLICTWTLRYILNLHTIRDVLFSSTLVSMLLYNGAFFTPEISFLVFTLILAYRNEITSNNLANPQT